MALSVPCWFKTKGIMLVIPVLALRCEELRRGIQFGPDEGHRLDFGFKKAFGHIHKSHFLSVS